MGIVCRVCVFCQTPFTTECPAQVYCAPKCRVARSRAEMAPLAIVDCQHCGVPMELRRREQLPGGKRPQKYCSHECRGEARRGVPGPWNLGGRHVDRFGYVNVLVAPDDPLAAMRTKHGTVREHRLVMARHLGRVLLPDEIVHHINGVKQDNRIENLQIVDSREHTRMHSAAMLESRWKQ